MMKIKGRSHVERYSKTCPVRTSLQRNHVGPTLKPQLLALSVQIIQKVPNSHAPEKDSRTIYLTTPVVVFFRPTPTQHTELSSLLYIISSLSHSFSSMAQAELQEKQTNAPDSGQKYDFVGEEMERHRKRRKRRKRDCVTVEFVEKKKKGGVLRRDPLEVFGTDIMLMILSNLDARSVALSLVVSRGWYGVASSDRIWSPKLEELWLGKAHIPRLMQIRGLSKLVAYSLAVMDGKRNRIMKDDLCDHAWEFHFNKGAPEYWRNLDPYWKGTGPPMRRYFHPDGSQSADPDDKVWGGHECCYLTVTSIAGEGKIREHYVRINRWPRMSVSRKHDWSWELSNHLYSYSSIPDANKEGGTGPQYGVM